MANNSNARKEIDDLQLDRNKYEEYQDKISEAGEWKIWHWNIRKN